MVEVLFGVVNFILCGFNQARGHGAKIIALGILNCVGRLVGTAVRFFSCGPYDFTPVRLDFCNWGKIRASSLSVPKNRAQGMERFLERKRRRPRSL